MRERSDLVWNQVKAYLDRSSVDAGRDTEKGPKQWRREGKLAASQSYRRA